ncbi:LysR family transcriptional regulator [Pantoea sp. FN0307]|uniref:LysR family transcriptional regulator n=1 Tax=Pantoea sp. FN0307 TaxID=3418560 RepID=UPI003CF72848
MDLGAIAAFVAAAEGGNFTVAAAELGISASGVSKAVSRLENELHVRLFNRTTRSLSLTADGTALYQRCKQILNDLDDAKLAMSHAQHAPQGRLHISIPAAFGRSRVIPVISTFMQHYPQVKVDASVTDRFVDVVEEGFDVIVRIGDLPDTRMVARSLGVTRFVVAASPHYFQQHPRPEKPEDLRNHNCVSFISPQTKRISEWLFFRNNQKIVHIPAGTLSLDDGEAMIDAAISDSGVIYCQDYMIENAVKEGKLERVLDDFITPEKPVVVMYPQNRHLSPKVRVFVDFMVAHFS